MKLVSFVKRRHGSESGFTLVEMLVSVAVLGIIMASLAQIYTSITAAMFSAQAQGNMIENLNMVADQMGSDLRNLARNNQTMRDRYGKNYYRFVIVDGDNKYESSTKVQHGSVGVEPNARSDRMHLLATYSNDELSNRIGSLGDSSRVAASERVYLAYWVNGPVSPNTKSEYYSRWGIVKRRRIHSKETRKNQGLMIPYYSAEGQTAPLLDTNTSGSNHTGVAPFAFNVDYLSVRAYDGGPGGTNSWVEDGSTGHACSSGSADDGANILWDSNACGRYPTAVEFAIRGYDGRANDGNTPSRRLVDPIWFKTTVSLR